MVGQADTIDVLLRLQDFTERELKQFNRNVKKSGRVGEKSFKDVEKSAKRTELSIGKLAVAAASVFAAFQAGRGLLSAGFGFVQDASDAEESISKFNAVFREEADRTLATLETYADVVGRSTVQLQTFAAGLQDTFVPLGFARDQAADLSIALTTLATDVASFSNRADADVVRDFQSAIVGNTESVLKYGLVIRQANAEQEALRLGLIEQGEELDGLALTAARASLIIKGTADAQGDALRTADSYANTLRRLQARFGELRVATGAFIRDELLDLIDKFGGADEVARKAASAFAFVGIATVGAVRVFAAFAEALINFVADSDAVTKAIAGIGQVGVEIEFAIRRGVAAIPLLTAIFKSELAQINLEFLNFEARVIELVNSLSDLPFLNVSAINPLTNNLARLTAELEVQTEALAEEGAFNAYRKNLQAIDEDQRKVEERVRSFAEGLGSSAGEVDKLRNSLGELLAEEGGLESFFNDLIADIRESRDAANEASGAFGAFARFGIETALTLAQQKVALDAAAIATAELAAEKEKQVAIEREAAVAAAETAAQLARQRSLFEGASEATSQYAASLSDFQLGSDLAGGLFRTFDQGVTNLSRSLVKGEADFRAFGQSIIEQIGEIITNILLLRSVRGLLGVGSGGGLTGGGVLSLFGFAKGGVMPGSMGSPLPVNAYAGGGVASSPQVALFGEGRGAEAFVPLPDGRSIPVTMNGGGFGGPMVMNITIQALDQQSVRDLLNKESRVFEDAVARALRSNSNRDLVTAVGITRG